MSKKPIARRKPVARVAGIDYLDLGQHLGYALRRAQVAAFDAFHRATAGVGITPPRFTALVILQANPGISQSTLGEVLGTARSGAMLLADWLEARGLAERRHRTDDGRAWGLYLTARGQRLIERLRRRVRAYDQRFAARIRPGERRELLRLLEKLAP
ncbi:MAG TPA: MarR family transcriptional regulator [Burkholderiales bacterium]|nr:MarR family transcriptional regulator [Burkholderiales bacterium]